MTTNQDYFEKKDELAEQIEELDNILKDLSYMDTNYDSHKSSQQQIIGSQKDKTIPVIKQNI